MHWRNGSVFTPEEFASKGESIYDDKIRAHLLPSDAGKYVLIDIKSGDFEVDPDEISASDRLLARHPNAQTYMIQAGYPTARWFGGHSNGSAW